MDNGLGFRGALEAEGKCPREGTKDKRFQECGRSRGQGIQRLEGVQVVLGCPPRVLGAPPSKAPGSADCSHSMFLALPVAAPLLHVFSLAGAGWWRGSRIPLCGMGRTAEQGGEPRVRAWGWPGGRPAIGPAPRAWACGGSCLPLTIPFPCPPGLLGCRTCQLGPCQAKQLPGGEEEAFPSREAPMGSVSTLESPFLTAK